MGTFRRVSAVTLISLAIAGVGFACSSFRGEGEPSGPEADGAVGTDSSTTVSPDGSSALDAAPGTSHVGPCGHWLCESFDDPNGVVSSQLVASFAQGATLGLQNFHVSPPHSLGAVTDPSDGGRHAQYSVNVPLGASERFQSITLRAKVRVQAGGGYFMRIELPSANAFLSEAYSANLFAGGTARIEQAGAGPDGGHVYDNGGNSSLPLRTDTFYDIELSLHHASSGTTVTFKINGTDIDSRAVSSLPDLTRNATVRFGIENFATEPTTVLFDDLTVDYVTE